jgi:hypothetical protein
MKITVKRFGEILTSRPEGREAALLLLANEFKSPIENIELDFIGVLVLTPSWLGELVATIQQARNVVITYSHTENASVRQSIEMTMQMPSRP